MAVAPQLSAASALVLWLQGHSPSCCGFCTVRQQGATGEQGGRKGADMVAGKLEGRLPAALAALDSAVKELSTDFLEKGQWPWRCDLAMISFLGWW